MGELRRRSPAAPSSRPLIPAHIAASVRRPDRLAQVRRSGLLDTAPEEPFDRLACELLDAPDGFVTVVDELRSFWKSCIGVSGGDRQNSVDESFCQYVIATGNAVIIDDARLDPMTMDNPSITSMGVFAWAGFGLRIGADDASRAAEQARASAVRYQQIAKTLQPDRDGLGRARLRGRTRSRAGRAGRW